MSQEQTTPVSFESMDLSPEILKAVRAMGFQEPSTVQARTIPLMMSGADINAIAPTGTGKTCAFGIPMLEYIQLKDSRIQEVVLAPTRELALQIGEELTRLAKYIQGEHDMPDAVLRQADEYMYADKVAMKAVRTD